MNMFEKFLNLGAPNKHKVEDQLDAEERQASNIYNGMLRQEQQRDIFHRPDEETKKSA